MNLIPAFAGCATSRTLFAIGLTTLQVISPLIDSLSAGLSEIATTLRQAGLSANDVRISLAALAKTELTPKKDGATE